MKKIIVLALVLIAVGSANADLYQRHYFYPQTQWDSVFVEVYVGDGDTLAFLQSTWIITSDTLALVLDADSSYQIHEWWYVDTVMIGTGQWDLPRLQQWASVKQIETAVITAIVDAIFGNDTTGYYADAGSFGEAILESGGGTSVWTSAERDSVIAALTDAAMRAKIWTGGTRALSVQDWTTSSDLAPLGTVANQATLMADVLRMIDSVYVLLDSLESQSVWAAKEGSLLTTSDRIGIDFSNVVGQIDASEIGTDVFETIADYNWDEPLAEHTTPESVGDVLYDSLDAKMSSAGGVAEISDADMAAIVDSFYNRDTSGYYDIPGVFGKVFLESGATTIWTATQRDSVINALADAAISNKIWVFGDPTVRNAILDKTGYSLSAGGIDAIWDEDTTGHVVPNSFGLMLKDTSAFQGTAAGTTPELIYQYFTQDSNEDAFKTTAGTGPFTLRVYTIDTSGVVDTISGVSVGIQDATGTPISGAFLTTTEGWYEYNVPGDSIRVVAYRGTGYEFPLTGLTVTGNDTFNVYGYNTVALPPSDADLATVSAYEYWMNGQPLSGVVVKVTPPPGTLTNPVDRYNVAKLSLTDTTGADGLWSVDLLRSGSFNISEENAFYNLTATVKYGGQWLTLWRYDSLHIGPTGNINLTDSL